MSTSENMTIKDNKLPGLSKLTMDDFKEHRKCFFETMSDNSIAFFPAASEVTRSNDTEYTFCQNKNFYYLTGFNEPDAFLILLKSNETE